MLLLPQLLRIQSLVFQILNRRHDHGFVLFICDAIPFVGGLQHLYSGFFLLQEFVHYKRKEKLTFQRFFSRFSSMKTANRS